jgi:hypothetical protein
MNGRNLIRGIGGFVLAASLLCGTAIISSTTAQAQRGGHGGGGGGFHGGGFHGGGHSSVIIRPRFGFGSRFGWGYPYGYYGYPYGYDSHYVFGDSAAADAQGYQDGLKTGANDARRDQSNNPERSHYFKDAGFGNFADDYRQGFLRGYSEGFSG